MGGGGGKGGSQETTVELDPRIEEGGATAVSGALRSAALPFRAPNAVTTAAFTPQEMASMQGASMAASAFGLPSAGVAPMPEMRQNQMGIRGFNTFGEYQNMVNQSIPEAERQERQNILNYYGRKGREIDRMEGLEPGGGGGK